MYLWLKNCFFVENSKNFPSKGKQRQRNVSIIKKLEITVPERREKLIRYKSPVLSKRQPNLFQIYANWKKKQKPFSKQTMSRE